MKYLIIVLFIFVSGCSSKSWRDASRESVGIAPKASELTEDIVIIYYARAFSWRGYFGIHPWIAYKKVGDDDYTVAQVTAWNIRRQGTAIRIEKDLPDRQWFDSHPNLLFEARGEIASKIISQIPKLIQNYPFKDTYSVWPGPNSNTFIAYLIRNIEELDIELPPTAVGKDYLGSSQFFAGSASGTGFTFSAFGYIGFTLGAAEGLELNLLGLHLGVDIWTPAIKLPIFGRLGFSDKGF